MTLRQFYQLVSTPYGAKTAIQKLRGQRNDHYPRTERTILKWIDFLENLAVYSGYEIKVNKIDNEEKNQEDGIN